MDKIITSYILTRQLSLNVNNKRVNDELRKKINTPTYENKNREIKYKYVVVLNYTLHEVDKQIMHKNSSKVLSLAVKSRMQ